MLATHPPFPTSSHYYYDYYTPARSSPLAASATMSNMSFSSPTTTSQFSFATPHHHEQQSQHQHQQPQQPINKPSYANRYATTIANPLSRRADTGISIGTSPTARANRRTLFLNRIKQDRDAGRFEARGEQLVLMDDVAEEKKWREAMGRRAERYMRGFGIREDGYEAVDQEDADAELDDFLSQEQEMERAEIALAAEQAQLQEQQYQQQYQKQQQQQQQQQGQNPSPDVSLSYSDGEYDDIFMDLAETLPQSQDQGMDMSSD